MSELEMRGYAVLLERVKSEVQSARTRAALAVNRELVELYWRLGRLILDRQDAETYGTKVIERLAADLRVAFPEMRGLGRRNLHYMRSFAEAWPDIEVVQRLIAQLPWGHNVELLSGLDAPSDRVWYAEQAIAHGWSRNVLAAQMMSKLHLRSGAAPSNFSTALPPSESELVQQLIKDPYHLDFLDLLFFHIPTKRYVVVELKRSALTPEAAGKLNFYVNVVDDQLRTANEASTIGLLLCRTRSDVVVRYALSGVATPMAGSLRQRGKISWQLRVLAGRDEITGKKSWWSAAVAASQCSTGKRESRPETHMRCWSYADTLRTCGLARRRGCGGPIPCIERVALPWGSEPLARSSGRSQSCRRRHRFVLGQGWRRERRSGPSL